MRLSSTWLVVSGNEYAFFFFFSFTLITVLPNVLFFLQKNTIYAKPHISTLWHLIAIDFGRLIFEEVVILEKERNYLIKHMITQKGH